MQSGSHWYYGSSWFNAFVDQPAAAAAAVIDQRQICDYSPRVQRFHQLVWHRSDSSFSTVDVLVDNSTCLRTVGDRRHQYRLFSVHNDELGPSAKFRWELLNGFFMSTEKLSLCKIWRFAPIKIGWHPRRFAPWTILPQPRLRQWGAVHGVV